MALLSLGRAGLTRVRRAGSGDLALGRALRGGSGSGAWRSAARNAVVACAAPVIRLIQRTVNRVRSW